MFPNESGSLHIALRQMVLDYIIIQIAFDWGLSPSSLLPLYSSFSFYPPSVSSSQQKPIKLWPTEIWPRKFCPIQWICRLNIIFIRSQLDLHTCYVFSSSPPPTLVDESRSPAGECTFYGTLCLIARYLLYLSHFRNTVQYQIHHCEDTTENTTSSFNRLPPERPLDHCKNDRNGEEERNLMHDTVINWEIAADYLLHWFYNQRYTPVAWSWPIINHLIECYLYYIVTAFTYPPLSLLGPVAEWLVNS